MSKVPWRAQVAARSVSSEIGRLTANRRMTPSFLICGAQRCGSTAMHKALTQHPMVVWAVLNKGIHYFDTGYAHGFRWYRGHFPLERHARRIEEETGRRPITGESSPYYLFHPLAGRRFAADLPGVRIIVLVRDPVERAYSAHTHETARGFETEPFERALELEEERLAGEAERIERDPRYYSFHHQHHGYLTRGRYVEQLTRMEKLLGRDRIHVVDSTDWFAEPEETFAGVTKFLGLDRCDEIRFERHNARPRAPMPDSLRRRLEEHFVPSDAALADWLGRTPGWRR